MGLNHSLLWLLVGVFIRGEEKMIKVSNSAMIFLRLHYTLKSCSTSSLSLSLEFE